MIRVLSTLILFNGGALALLKPIGNILLLDHLNINHQRGRHDILKSFYIDVLGLQLDPSKFVFIVPHQNLINISSKTSSLLNT